MFEPIILPIAISAFFLIKLVIEAAVSGRLVPIATIVNPTIRSETPNSLAIYTAPLTRYSAPSNINRKLIANVAVSFFIDRSVALFNSLEN